MGLDASAIEGLRAIILTGGVRQLAVGDLRADDLADLAWSDNPAHVRSVAAALHRAAQGLEDYLVARAPGGQPVAKMRVDYTDEDDTSVFSQLATMGPLQGLGIATMLISVGEQRVRARGLAFAALGVQYNNPRARRLYKRFGYQAAGRRHASWEYEETPVSSGCTKPRSRSCAGACNAGTLTTPRAGQPESVISRFLLRGPADYQAAQAYRTS